MLAFQLADPLDNLTQRAVNVLACQLCAALVFTFGGQSLGLDIFNNLLHFFANLFQQVVITTLGDELIPHCRLVGFHTIDATEKGVDIVLLLGEAFFKGCDGGFVASSFFIEPFNHPRSLIDVHTPIPSINLLTTINCAIITHILRLFYV